jgi:hypothetical protein
LKPRTIPVSDACRASFERLLPTKRHGNLLVIHGNLLFCLFLIISVISTNCYTNFMARATPHFEQHDSTVAGPPKHNGKVWPS